MQYKNQEWILRIWLKFTHGKSYDKIKSSGRTLEQCKENYKNLQVYLIKELYKKKNFMILIGVEERTHYSVIIAGTT